ncbi:carbohydrate kinase [Streptomyces sviceus ATCC 29083]|uniref:Carbohydrate kinase n=1 Tax=Streptomyces sviceus (strain ATCC 29083 / DSM 924 / JCM 4929 / NBRC 13980 / NCIMB 11184 / NRRL 5439 / UC 5370) TaxID=463191 RepID=D6XBL3_STRX2|nr:carbohydrate kinase [Streptomyces sviceus ATCC 29083]
MLSRESRVRIDPVRVGGSDDRDDGRERDGVAGDRPRHPERARAGGHGRRNRAGPGFRPARRPARGRAARTGAGGVVGGGAHGVPFRAAHPDGCTDRRTRGVRDVGDGPADGPGGPADEPGAHVRRRTRGG